MAFSVGAKEMTAVLSRSDMILVRTPITLPICRLKKLFQFQSLLTISARGSLYPFSVRHFRPSGCDSNDIIYDSHRSSHRLLLDLGHVGHGHCRPRACPFTFFSVSTNSFHFWHYHFSNMSSLISNRCLTLRAPHGLGFISGLGCYHSRIHQLHCLVRYAPDPRQPES